MSFGLYNLLDHSISVYYESDASSVITRFIFYVVGLNALQCCCLYRKSHEIISERIRIASELSKSGFDNVYCHLTLSYCGSWSALTTLPMKHLHMNYGQSQLQVSL